MEAGHQRGPETANSVAQLCSENLYDENRSRRRGKNCCCEVSVDAAVEATNYSVYLDMTVNMKIVLVTVVLYCMELSYSETITVKGRRMGGG